MTAVLVAYCNVLFLPVCPVDSCTCVLLQISLSNSVTYWQLFPRPVTEFTFNVRPTVESTFYLCVLVTVVQHLWPTVQKSPLSTSVSWWRPYLCPTVETTWCPGVTMLTNQLSPPLHPLNPPPPSLYRTRTHLTCGRKESLKRKNKKCLL